MGAITLLGITEAALLIALGFGFIIIFLGHKEDEKIRGLSHGIGMTIIALSLFFIGITVVVAGITGPSMKGSYMVCPMMQK